jgi:hypothetical protein
MEGKISRSAVTMCTSTPEKDRTSSGSLLETKTIRRDLVLWLADILFEFVTHILRLEPDTCGNGLPSHMRVNIPVFELYIGWSYQLANEQAPTLSMARPHR